MNKLLERGDSGERRGASGGDMDPENSSSCVRMMALWEIPFSTTLNDITLLLCISNAMDFFFVLFCF